MEMFILSYANVLCIYPTVFKSDLTNQYVIFRYCSPNLCKQNYLYGDLPFFKIQVNHFMAQDEPFGAKIIPKCILWVRVLVLSFKKFLSFINRLLVTILEKEMAAHSSVLAWRIPDMGGPGGLPSIGSHRVRHD